MGGPGPSSSATSIKVAGTPSWRSCSRCHWETTSKNIWLYITKICWHFSLSKERGKRETYSVTILRKQLQFSSWRSCSRCHWETTSKNMTVYYYNLLKLFNFKRKGQERICSVTIPKKSFNFQVLNCKSNTVKLYLAALCLISGHPPFSGHLSNPRNLLY